MLKKTLIANRGEIAVRIIRACRELGILTVAVYSEADKNAIHTRLADEAVCIGSAQANKSYLNIKNILEAAILTGCDSIHPGYGFLSESSHFAKVCEESNLEFIGPSSELIDLMGMKINCKNLMREEGIPVLPGSNGSIKSFEEAKELAKKIGYPIMIKATNGGGGKGIRKVENEAQLEDSYDLVKKEAKISFGNDDIYIEKFIENPRHIEIQILADKIGNVLCLGERDCTIQRKHQKILEESPSTIIDNDLRMEMGKAAMKAAQIYKYFSTGTVEFLVDKNKKFYFMEMNTRIQVEHPVTEMITGVDIVKEQLRIASGEQLRFKQENLTFTGHSIECRINAENPEKDFMPMSGEIKELNLPGGNGVRLDTAVYSGYKISPFYDSMIAKIIVHGEDRDEAIAKMKRALDECVIEGVTTNIDYLYSILEDEDFVLGNFDTSFIERKEAKRKKDGNR